MAVPCPFPTLPTGPCSTPSPEEEVQPAAERTGLHCPGHAGGGTRAWEVEPLPSPHSQHVAPSCGPLWVLISARHCLPHGASSSLGYSQGTPREAWLPSEEAPRQFLGVVTRTINRIYSTRTGRAGQGRPRLAGKAQARLPQASLLCGLAGNFPALTSAFLLGLLGGFGATGP